MVDDPQAKDLLRLRLLRGYGLTYLNGTKGGAVYISGGDYYNKNDYNGNISSVDWAETAGWASNDKIFKLSLDKPWGAQTATYDTLVPRLTVYNSPSSGPGIPSEYGAVLPLPRTSGFGTGYGALVSVGGVVNDSTRGDIWTFTGESSNQSAGVKSSARFGAVKVTNSDDFKSEFGGSAVDHDGKVWILGGNNAQTDAGGGVSQLRWLDPRTGDSGSYPASGEGSLAPTGTNWFQSSMVWVPVGKKGILVAMGGVLSKSTSIQAVQMDKVAIFDIATEKWYLQTAVANPSSNSALIPSSRASFCSVTPVRAGSQPGVKNWEIFFYGGRATSNPTTFGAFDDFWSLSIPSFTWTRIWQGNNAVTGKWGRSCALLNDVFYGFVDLAPTDNTFNQSTTPILSFFDVTGTQFVEYSAPGSVTRTYSTPLLVQSAVDGSGNKPPGGFTEGLGQVFAAAANPPKPKHRAPAIAGGVIGGLTLLLFIGLAFLWWRKRKNRYSKSGNTSPGSGAELDGNAVSEVHGASVPLQPGAFSNGKERYAKIPIGDPELATPPVELPAHDNGVDPYGVRPVAELQA